MPRLLYAFGSLLAVVGRGAVAPVRSVDRAAALLEAVDAEDAKEKRSGATLGARRLTANPATNHFSENFRVVEGDDVGFSTIGE